MSLADRTRSTRHFILNWQRVRMLGQLSLLNRLAFTLLVVVPLITAFWPAMYTTTDKYNGMVESANDLLRIDLPLAPEQLAPEQTTVTASADPLDAGGQAGETNTVIAEDSAQAAAESDVDLADGVNPQPGESATPSDQPPALSADQIAARSGWDRYLESKIRLVESRFANLMTAMFPQPVETPLLPRTWALGFFAALAILIGDTVLQLFCPSAVRYQCAIEFVDSRAATYSSAPSQTMLDACVDRLRDSDDRASELARTELDWQTRYRTSASQLDASLQSIQTQLESPDADPTTADAGRLRDQASYLSDRLADLRAIDSTANSAALHRRVSIIRGGSRLIYRDLSAKNPLAIIASSAGYLAGGYCIVMILYEQSFNVARAAGW